MSFQLTDYTNIIEALAAAVAIVVALSGAIIKIYRYIKNRKSLISTYYVSREIFADREQSLFDLIRVIKSDVRVINIYGRRGIGKSSFLRFFCDFTNHKLGKENKKRKFNNKYIHPAKGHAIYLQLSGEGAHSIEEQITRQAPGSCSSLRGVAEYITRKIRQGNIFIVIDNVNNAGLCRELEGVIDAFLTYSTRYRIVIGSIEKQYFFNITNENQINYMELSVFDASDIFDFASKNNKLVSSDYLSKILDFSEGLPVFVSLLLNNSMSPLSNLTYDRKKMDHYLFRILNELETSLCVLAQYIGFLSITTASFSTRLLKELGISFSVDSLEKLERCSLIEFEENTQTIKMHEIFRDYICRHYSDSKNIIQTIYGYFLEKNCLYEQVYYLVLIDDKTETISLAIEKAITEENFTFLLMLGEHYKNIYGLNPNIGIISESTFLIIIYGYLEGQIGVGNYAGAREVIDRCKIAARSPQNDLQFRFSMLTAKLYHLQNDYEESIACYKILLEATQSDRKYAKYEAACLWGIAHSYRHQGDHLDIAIEYYDRSIFAAERLGRKSEIIKSMREKLIILLLRNQKYEARRLYHMLRRKANKLPKFGYIETKISLLKTEVDYIRVMAKRGSCSLREHTLLHKVLSHYKLQNKRLQYNQYFQLGEVYRQEGHYDLARENYKTSLNFSEKNLDHNLESLSIIALTICDICANDGLEFISKERLIQCIEASEQYNLHINKMLAEVLLSYKQGIPVDGEVKAKILQCHYISAVSVCTQMTRENLEELNLFLM